MTFNITWELEKVDLWNDNGRFSDPALTTIYERTKIGHEKEQELQLTISKHYSYNASPIVKVAMAMW